MVGIILKVRGEVPLEDEPSEPPISQGLLVLWGQSFYEPQQISLHSQHDSNGG